MRKLFFLVPVFALVACGNSKVDEIKERTRKSQEAMKEKKADEELLKRATAIFQPLPDTAISVENPITAAKVELGQMLYFDTRLSKDGKNSCNSCHNLSTFGVDNKATSEGDAGKLGERNSPTVLNAAVHTMQFWDGRAKNVEEQAGMPILNPVEMNIPSKDFLVKRLKGIKEYQNLFRRAFPDDKDPLTYANLEKAIGAFERTLMTPGKFDDFLKGDVAALSKEEKAGLTTFMDVGCTTCHTGPALGGNMFQKFGLYADYRTLTGSTTNDEGRKKETGQEADKDMFKVPSLRNITKTGPYFHDGSVADLNKAIHVMGKAQLNKELTNEEISSIMVFLEALTIDIPEEKKKAPTVLAEVR